MKPKRLQALEKYNVSSFPTIVGGQAPIKFIPITIMILLMESFLDCKSMLEVDVSGQENPDSTGYRITRMQVTIIKEKRDPTKGHSSRIT